MIATSKAITTAFGFLGFGTLGSEPDRTARAMGSSVSVDEDKPASPDLLSPGEPCFEAVAAALRRTGHLAS